MTSAGEPGSEPRRARTLHLLASTDQRGAESFAVELAELLADAGWPVDVAALAPGQVGGIDVPVLARRPLSPVGLLRLRHRAGQVDVVVGHGSRTLPAGAVATPGTGARFVYRNIGDPLFWAGTPLRRMRVSWFLGRADTVVALWPGSAEALISRFGVRSDKVVVIPNGRPAHRFPPVDPERRAAARARFGLGEGAVAAFAGSLTQEKRVDLAIDAVALIDDLTLLVAGGGPLRPALERRAAERTGGRVRFLGPVTDTSAVLAAADVVLLTSDSEGQPGVLIEAGLSGLAVVSTDVGGVAEIVDDGVTGLLVPAGDVPATAEALRRVLAAPGPMGEAGHRRCLEHFEIRHIARRWEDLLAGLGAGG